MRGLPGLPSRDFDQRRLLAADIGPRAEVDLDVEVEALRAAYARAEQPVTAHRLELRLQRLEQIAIFAAQIEEASRRADDEAGDRHPLEHTLGV